MREDSSAAGAAPFDPKHSEPTEWASDRRMQVARQHRVVANLAMSIARLSMDCAEMILSGHHDAIITIQGETSARWMETLGDMLNGVDAASEDDIRWMTPLFEKAREMFPDPSPPAHEVSHPSPSSPASGMLAALEKLAARKNFDNPAHAVHGCTFYMQADEYRDICAAIAAAKAAGIK